MIKLMLITNNPVFAIHAYDAGVQRIFVDLEILGKQERQGHLDTVISSHSLEDIKVIRAAVPECELLVRINPLNECSAEEIDQAINNGADLIMLPMFTTLKEVEIIAALIGGRAKFIPLVETASGAGAIQDIVKVVGVDEVYIGLNDLHRDMGMSFMFEPLTDGTVDKLAKVINLAGLPFGFGGVARIGEGLLPAEKLLAEHVRLGSSNVILSRTFHRRSESVNELESYMCLKTEVGKIQGCIEQLAGRNESEECVDSMEVKTIVQSIIGSIKNNEKNI